MIKRFAFTLLAVFLAANLWGQTLAGSGTEESPYQITSADEWNIFANVDNAATYWASGVYTRLDANITVSDMVGTSDIKYSGVFDGNGHILTFNCGSTTTPYTNEACAPFSYINGATIKNLIVDGTIVSSNKYAGGFVGKASGTNTISNSTSNINIDCSYKTSDGGDCSCGGFVGLEENSAIINFNNCLFNGNIFDVP